MKQEMVKMGTPGRLGPDLREKLEMGWLGMLEKREPGWRRRLVLGLGLAPNLR